MPPSTGVHQQQQSTMSAGASSPSPTATPSRSQFRRQGSSYGPSHVHHMAVMVAPTRPDYSVNKGGLRSWVVLIVFVLLCSAILTIFSEESSSEEKEELASSDEVDRMAEQKEEEINDNNIPPTIVESKETEDEEREDEEEEEEEGNEGNEEEEEDRAEAKVSEEEKMLAQLTVAAERRRKAKEEKKRKREEDIRTARKIAERQQIKEKEEEKEEEEEEPIEEEKEEEPERERRPQRRRKDRKKSVGVEIETQAVEEENEEIERERPKKKKKKGRKMVEEEEGEEEEEKAEEEEQRKCVEPKKGRRVREREQEREREEGLGKRRKGREGKEVEEVEEKSDEEDEVEEGTYLLKKDRPRRKHVRSWRDTFLQSNEGEQRRPRVGLLKHKKRRLVVYGEEKPEEENGETEAGETEDSMEEPVHEMVALRKRPAYNRKEITNKYDYRNRHLLDLADFYLEKHDFSAAMHHYGRVLAISGDSPRALFGRARAYLLMSEFDGEGKGTGRLLANAMADFGSVLENEETPDGLFRAAVRYFVECARLVGGQQHRIIQIQRSLVDRFPDEAEVQCELGATWLGMDRPEEAKAVFRNVLDAHPDNVLALAYLGYIWKVHDGELEKSVHALRRAMRSDDPTVLGQARFYFHLGDGLVRMGRDKEAREVYAEAAERGLFLSALQRSVHNLEGLSARPWWSLDQVECAKQLRQLERHWTVIREEALRVWEKRRTLFVEEPLQLASGAGGEWTLALRSNAEGGFHAEVCDRLMPSTCELLRPISASACAKDEMRLSVLLAGTRTWPQCGPTNYVLQAHLTLSSPSEARIRVGQETRGWRQGRVLVLDTSFEREISFEGAASNALRVAIVIELWHPEVPKQLRGAIQEEEEGPDEK